MAQVVPLHNHSEYSVFDGYAKVDEITARVKEIGSEHVALTDHGVVSGHLAFNKACQAAGIHPIFGMEAYQARTNRAERWKDEKTGRIKDDAFHLVLLAQNDKGLQNLWRLSSLAHATGFWNKPRLDWDLLRENSEGLIATSACMGGMVAWDIGHERTTNLERYLDIFEDKFYIELHTYDSPEQKRMNIELVSLAKDFGLPLVYATDAHYARLEDYKYHEAFTAIAHHQALDDPKRVTHPPSLWIQSEEDIRGAFSYLPKGIIDEAIDNSKVIAESCVARIPEPKNRVPKYVHHEDLGMGSVGTLMRLVREGAEFRGVYEDEDYAQRAIDELNVITDFPILVDYFLIQYDINRYAREKGYLVGPGRGSVGGSLVAYLLRITDIDPLRYGLIFERFYNAGREKGGLPDIDTDFPASVRPDIKRYVGEKYGEENVAAIGTTLRFHGRSAIDRVNSLFKLPEIDIIVIKNIINDLTDAGMLASWETVIAHPEMQKYITKYPDFFDMVGHFHGRIFASGVHASGYLIGNTSLYDTFPLKWNAEKRELSSQFDFHEAEDMGLLKNDFLGLTKLDALVECIKIVKEIHGIDITEELETLHHKSDDELAALEDMWRMLHKGMTIGIFQVEDGKNARKVMKAIKPTSVEELAIVVSINRPGPNSEEYISRRSGSKWDHIHPILEDVLDETYGIFVFQESIIRYMVKIGFTLEEADNVRKIVGKKLPAEMAALHPAYMDKATQHMDDETAQEIWDAISKFAKYGFNKSHSVAYAITALRTAWIKWAYPAEYMLACIRIDSDNKHLYIEEARRMGVETSAPDINKSGFETSLVDGVIVYGLKDIKGVKEAASWVIENRPFKSRTQMQEVLEDQNKDFLVRKKDGEVDKAERSPKQRFGSNKITALYNAGAFDQLEPRDISMKDRRVLETELLGCVVTNKAPTVVARHREALELICDSIDDVTENDIYNLFGYILNIKEQNTRNGQKMLRLTIENRSDTIEVAVFNDMMKRYEHILQEYMPIVFQVKNTGKGLNLVQARELR